jgi:hypothetical protein
MIIIFSGADDAVATVVEDKLRARGAEVVRFDGADYPSQVALCLRVDSRGRSSASLTLAGRRIDLSSVTAIWERRPNWPHVPAALAGSERAFVSSEARAILGDLWMHTDGLFFPGRLDRTRAANFKAWQLRCATQVGFAVPETLLTNDPRAVLRFCRERNGDLISKLGHGNPIDEQNSRVRYTEALTARDLTHIQELRHCPMLFQAYVPKQVEVRATVVGARVFAVEIQSQGSVRARHDWRRRDRDDTPYAIHALPDPVSARCASLVAAMGLHYGAIDLIRTPEGEYVFLEINCNGQWAWLEAATGVPISDAIADYLAAAGAVAHG